MTKKANLFLVILLSVLTALCVAMGIGVNTAKAESDPVFIMENGVYLKTSATGMRFIAKMDEGTYQDLSRNDNKSLKFIIAPKVLFDKVTDGKYIDMEQKILVEADDYTKYYKQGEFYYVNGCVYNMKSENLKLDYTALAVIETKGEPNIYKYATEGDTVRNVYNVVNDAVLDANVENTAELLNVYDFIGKEEYPLIAKTTAQYKVLAERINNDTLKPEQIVIGSEVDKTQAEIDSEKLDPSAITNTYTVKLYSESKELIATILNVEEGTTAQTVYDLVEDYNLSKEHYDFAWYVFDGENELFKVEPTSTVSQDVDLIAHYDAVKYTITWKVGESETQTQVAYGTMPEYSGTPEKAEDTVAYEFKSWDKTIVNATESTTYNAVFYKKLLNKHASSLQSIIEGDLAGEYVLGEDIDMTGITFKSIGGVDSGSDIKQFTGSLDGKGFAIKNLTITARGAKDQYSVLITGASNFIANNGGTVKNIAFVNLTMANCANFVGVIGTNSGVINNVYADINLTGNMTSMAQMNGVIVARLNAGGTVKNCIVNIHASGLSGNQVFGTVVGMNYSGAEYPIVNCYAITNGMAISYGTLAGGGRDVLYGLSYNSDTRRPKDCANYETADALLTAVTELPSASGWAKYWKIENNTLSFNNYVIGSIA